MNDTRKQHSCPNHDTARMRVNRLLAKTILDQQAAYDAVLAKQSLVKVKSRLNRAFETAINQDLVETVEAYPTAGEHCEKVRTTLDTYMRCLANSMSRLSHGFGEHIASLDEQAHMLAVRYLRVTDACRKSGGIWWDAEFTFKTYVWSGSGMEHDYDVVWDVLDPFGFQQTSHKQVGKEIDGVSLRQHTVATTVEGLCALLLAIRHEQVEFPTLAIDRAVFFVPNLCHAQDTDCATPQQALERKGATGPIVLESRAAFDSVELEETIGTADANTLPRRFALGVLTRLLPRQANPHARYATGDMSRAYTLCDNAAHCIPEHRPNPRQYPRPDSSDSAVA